MTSRVLALVLGFALAVGLLATGSRLSTAPKLPCPEPVPPIDGSVPVSTP